MKFVNEIPPVTDRVQQVGSGTTHVVDVPRPLADALAEASSSLANGAGLEDFKEAINKTRNQAPVRTLKQDDKGNAGYIGIGVITAVMTVLTAIGIFTVIGKVLGY